MTMRKSVLIFFGALMMIALSFIMARAAPEVDSGLSPPSGEIVGQLLESAQAVAVQGDYAYVGFENDLAVIDIADKTMPTEVGRLDIGELVRKIAVSGEYAYLATTSGLQIVNIADPEMPQWGGIYEQYLVTQVQIRDEYAFILSADGLEILSLVNTPNLTQNGQFEADMSTPLDLDLVGNYAFLLGRMPILRNIIVVNISDLTEPSLETVFETFGADRIEIPANKLLAVDKGCSSKCFTYFDVFDLDSNMWTMSHIGTDTVFPSSWSFALEAGKLYAYAGKDIGLFVYSYHKQYVDGSPLQIDYFDTGDVQDILIVDEHVYVTGKEYDNGVDPPSAGGLFILLTPPLHEVYLPFVDG